MTTKSIVDLRKGVVLGCARANVHHGVAAAQNSRLRLSRDLISSIRHRQNGRSAREFAMVDRTFCEKSARPICSGAIAGFNGHRHFGRSIERDRMHHDYFHTRFGDRVLRRDRFGYGNPRAFLWSTNDKGVRGRGRFGPVLLADAGCDLFARSLIVELAEAALFHGQRGFHSAHGMKRQRTVDRVAAWLEVDLQRSGLARFRIWRQLLIDAFTFDLEGVLFSARILDHESSSASFRCRRHVEVILGHRDVDFLTALPRNHAN